MDSVTSGCINFVDTAINFRYQKSERIIRTAFQYLEDQNKIKREEIFISSKGGIIPEDAKTGMTVEQTISKLIKDRIIESDDVFEMSCLEPKFIRKQIMQSKLNLGVEQIDCYSLNLPEIWLGKISKPEFYQKLMVF